MSVIIVLGGTLVAAAIIYFILKTQGRAIHINTEKVPQAVTPPQSVTPTKEKDIHSTFGAAITNAIPIISLKGGPLSIFPPSRRSSLAFGLGSTTPSSDEVASPTAYSVEDVKSLGDYPDHAKITGVPLPAPYLDFDISKAKPRPYRPFRWAYHQTMSLTKMEPDWWLELESSYVERIEQRMELLEKHGKNVLDMQPGSELACKELMEMCVQFLCARYPHYFTFDETTSVLDNKILKKKFNLKEMEPLVVIMNNVPEDFAMVLRSPETGKYHFRAGAVCSSLGWNVATKIGMSLQEIHEHIPDYKEKMSMSMDRYFSKMPADKPIQRGSWGLEFGQPLYIPAGHPHESIRAIQSPDLTLEDTHLRVDWQTLRRLPLSNAVVFNFKAVFTPLTEFRDEPCMPALVLKILKEGKKNLMEYKNTWHVEHVAIPALEQWKAEQEENGLCEKDWEVRTLEDAPFFRGWQEKWHNQQGF